MALPKRTFAIAAGAGATAFTGAGGLYGITVRETTAIAAAGTMQVFDNTSAAGTLLATIRLAADGTMQINWKKGVRFSTGLHIAATGADIAGSLLVGSSGGLRAVPFAGADLLLLTGPASVDSILAAETAGAVAEWRMFDNTSAAGNEFAGGSPAANATQFLEWPQGLAAGIGLFYDQQAGAVSGNVYYQ